jgi:hypothetical protein
VCLFLLLGDFYCCFNRFLLLSSLSMIPAGIKGKRIFLVADTVIAIAKPLQ